MIFTLFTELLRVLLRDRDRPPVQNTVTPKKKIGHCIYKIYESVYVRKLYAFSGVLTTSLYT